MEEAADADGVGEVMPGSKAVTPSSESSPSPGSLAAAVAPSSFLPSID